MVGLYYSNVFDKSIILKQGSKARQGLENRGSNNSNQRWGKLRKDVAHALHPRSLKKTFASKCGTRAFESEVPQNFMLELKK